MIKFTEVRNQANTPSGEGRRGNHDFVLSEVWINENYVVNIREAPRYHQLLAEGRLPPALDLAHRFTAVTTNNGGLSETHIIIGDPQMVAVKLNHNTKTLLKG